MLYLENSTVNILKKVGRFFFFCSIFIFLVSCHKHSSSVTYATWYGLGPDKWASVWLLESQVHPSPNVQILPLNTPFNQQILFDVPQAKFQRNSTQTTYTQLLEHHKISDATLLRIQQILYDIEVNFWHDDRDPLSDIVESAFRELQVRGGRDSIAKECYVAFFNNIYKQIADNRKLSIDSLVPDFPCESQPSKKLVTQSVSEYSLDYILNNIKQNKNVIFVDAREAEEYREGHIPGAVNLQIRKVNKTTTLSLRDADLVVAYCVKDFRGYELARALARQGLSNVAIANPFGIKGWIDSGLPIVKPSGLSELQAVTRLKACAENSKFCRDKKDASPG